MMAPILHCKYMVTVDGTEFAICQGMPAVMEVREGLKAWGYPAWRLGLLKYAGYDDVNGVIVWECLV